VIGSCIAGEIGWYYIVPFYDLVRGWLDHFTHAKAKYATYNLWFNKNVRCYNIVVSAYVINLKITIGYILAHFWLDYENSTDQEELHGFAQDKSDRDRNRGDY